MSKTLNERIEESEKIIMKTVPGLDWTRYCEYMKEEITQWDNFVRKAYDHLIQKREDTGIFAPARHSTLYRAYRCISMYHEVRKDQDILDNLKSHFESSGSKYLKAENAENRFFIKGVNAFAKNSFDIGAIESVDSQALYLIGYVSAGLAERALHKKETGLEKEYGILLLRAMAPIRHMKDPTDVLMNIFSKKNYNL